MARNYVEQILEVKSRLRWKFATRVPWRITELRSELKEGADDLSAELLKYFPIATVACIEAFFRAAIQELIDTGSPYSDQIEKLNVPNLKFDTALVKAIAGKTITLGELIAHTVPLNNLDSINKVVSILVGADFFEEVQKVRDRVKVELEGAPDKPMLSNPELVFPLLNRTFELRHIFAHEADINFKPEAQEIKSCFYNSESFLNASAEYFSNLLFPDSPLTQTGMTAKAADDLAATRKQVEALTSAIVLKLSKDDRKTELEAMNSAFQEYSKTAAELVTNVSWGTGGTGRSMFYMVILRGFVSEHKKTLENIQKTLLRETD